MTAWPTGSVPFKPLLDGISETIGDNRNRFTSSSGRSLSRPMYSGRVDMLEVQILWTEAQFNDALAFYSTTLAEGSLAFTALHPRTGATTSFTFVKPIEYEIVGAMKYKAKLTLEYIV